MDRRAAYNLGKEQGARVASWVDLPELGSLIDQTTDWVGLGKTVTAKNVAEYFDLLAHASEQHSRQYSPFEFTAQELNGSRHPEDAWDAFDRGVDRGIALAWQKRKDYYTAG